jgi:hypothetical protein
VSEGEGWQILPDGRSGGFVVLLVDPSNGTCMRLEAHGEYKGIATGAQGI